ncbi:MAG: heme exporter protein CcmD [Proteobacteria bacterium]|nr:heme exporter protein CcmD [Pseudomonadota bacterium]|tara:strand:- start:714 stop:902 length:189 start_codon:yes stop_codon:yes gene_type:complete
MEWGSLSEFFDMGGYAKFVWGAYVFTFLLILLEVGYICRISRKVKKERDKSIQKIKSVDHEA